MSGLLEVIALHAADAERAEAGGADRIELCGTLEDGGMSPEPALVEKGRGLHERSCATCHTDGGRGGPGATPRMAGQWPAYLYMQMRDMHDPGYLGPSPLLMRQLIQQLSDDDLHALAHYYASQK